MAFHRLRHFPKLLFVCQRDCHFEKLLICVERVAVFIQILLFCRGAGFIALHTDAVTLLVYNYFVHKGADHRKTAATG